MKFITTEADIKNYALECAKSIVIRTYDNGNSKDTRRKTTKKEAEILYSLISGALISVKFHSGSNDEKGHKQTLQHAADTAEFISHGLIPDANGYDSVYTPIKSFIWYEE